MAAADKAYPGIGHVLIPTCYVVPDENTVPARLFGIVCEIGNDPWMAKGGEEGQVNSVVHELFRW